MIVDRWPISRLFLAIGTCLIALSAVLVIASCAGPEHPDQLRLVFVAAALLGFAAALGTLALGSMLGARLLALSTGLAGLAGGDPSAPARSGADSDSEIALLTWNVDRLASVLADALGDLREIHTGVVRRTTHLREATTGVQNSARVTSEMFGAIEDTSELVSHNVTMIATGSQELETSIGEIFQNVNEAAHVAAGAVASAESTTTTMNKLGDSSREIGDVVRLITSIAGQTNLLALNATIEAARAGSAGKGFAVVADEVKQLAQETARATKDVSHRVETIQEDADRAALSIAEVAGVIHQMSEYQSTIAHAVGKQRITSNAINSGASEAAQGASEIATRIAARASTAGIAAATMGHAMHDVAGLAEISEELEQVMNRFVQSPR